MTTIDATAAEPGTDTSLAMEVVVRPPEIEGDTFRVAWTQTEANPFQLANAFSFRYEGIDLACASVDLFTEIFLGLQLRVFAQLKRPVIVHFDAPVSAESFAFWQAFHRADQVTARPLKTVRPAPLWNQPEKESGRTIRNAVFFGGGKDSMLAASMLGEIDGPDQVLLIQHVAPLRANRNLAQRLEARQQGLMLDPAARQLGFATQRIWTDYQSNFRRGAERSRPHFELYTLGSLPAMLAHGVTRCTISMDREVYTVTRAPAGHVARYHYATSRPEMMATQSRHYRRSLGVDLEVTNVNLPFTSMSTQRVLTTRYRPARDLIVPCTFGGVGERWCHRCVKCAEFAAVSLAQGEPDSSFDYDRFFSASTWSRRLAEYAEQGIALTMHGNAPWQKFVSYPRVYLVLCHALALIDIASIAPSLGKSAIANLLTAQSLFGNRTFPSVELLLDHTFDLLPGDISPALLRIASQHLEVVSEIPGPFVAGRTNVDYDFTGAMVPATRQLEHIRG